MVSRATGIPAALSAAIVGFGLYGPIVSAQGQASVVVSSAPAEEKPTTALGIALEGYPYPYPVHFLGLTVAGKPLRMAFMDVPARGTAHPATAPVVVLLHGKNFPSSYWKTTIDTLADAGYRVIVPDQIGGFLNKSSRPDTPLTFKLLAENTIRLLDGLRVERAAIVGHSTGGMLAARLALAFPRRVSHLVLVDPLGLEDYRAGIPPQTTERLYREELSQTPEAYRAYVRRYFVHWKPEYEEYALLRERITRGAEFPRWAQASALTTQMIYEQPVRQDYPRIQAPTLIIVGEKDHTVPLGAYARPGMLAKMGQFPALAQAAARDIPHARAVILPESGHLPHLEQPDAFFKALLPFLHEPGSAVR